MGEPLVRPARPGDLAALTAIYNHYVETTAVTFDIDPLTLDERRGWMARFAATGRHRLLVAEIDGTVRGYASSDRFRDKRAYDTSVETTVYVEAGHAGRGIGTRLYESLFEALDGEDIHRAYAGIALPNPASIALHRRFGFEEIGVLDEAGRKFGRWWSVMWLEKPVAGAPPGSTSPTR